jgi:Ni/Co efflux regulator RcnB
LCQAIVLPSPALSGQVRSVDATALRHGVLSARLARAPEGFVDETIPDPTSPRWAPHRAFSAFDLHFFRILVPLEHLWSDISTRDCLRNAREAAYLCISSVAAVSYRHANHEIRGESLTGGRSTRKEERLLKRALISAAVTAAAVSLSASPALASPSASSPSASAALAFSRLQAQDQHRPDAHDTGRHRVEHRRKGGHRPRTVVVRPGQSFWSIGHRWGVDMIALAEYNHLDYQAPLDVGVTLHLPPRGWTGHSRGSQSSVTGSSSVSAEPSTPAAPYTPAASTAPAVSPSGVWACIARLESGGNPAEDTGNGYYGMYQFSLATWSANGGVGNPAAASVAEQTAVAERVQASQGWSAWPVTSGECGV